jgi:ornithine cyclodeaminase/alanine dehydrogenase-like protein (mu-crystallin family)
MPPHQLLYLSQDDVATIDLPMRQIIDAVEEAFDHMGNGRVEMPPKPGVHPRPDAFIHAMPAYINGQNAVGMKWVAGYPQNQAKGLPYISGLFILNDADTGLPLSVMDCTWLTAMRTGAATAVAAKYLARPDSKTVGILGCGVQGCSNLIALSELFSIEAAIAYDSNADRASQFAQKMVQSTGIKVTITNTPRKAVEDMDIVVTAGPILREPHATIQADWLALGAFAAPVDFDSYWSSDALAQATRICTDDHGQFQYYKKEGYFQTCPTPDADLGQIVSGQKPGRQSDADRNICINLGLAMEDVAVAPLIYELAQQRNIGTRLPLCT